MRNNQNYSVIYMLLLCVIARMAVACSSSPSFKGNEGGDGEDEVWSYRIDPPSGVKAELYNSEYNVIITWEAVKNADRYVVMRSINESMGYEVLTTNEETTSFVDLLPRDGKNNYVVYAISDNEMSEPSAAASVIYEKEVSFTVNSASFKMVKVVGGTFEMGQTGWKEYPSYTNEKPVHQVTLFDFCIGATEVTQDLWEAVMGSNPSWFKGTNLPVESVSWNDCQEFIKKLNSLTGKNFRLPTEAEWEYSARARTNQYWEYSGADESFIDAVAWYRDNSNGETHVVATKKPNSLGLYDMSGNVAEWCQDWYGDYGSEAQMNPSGPFSGSIRVSRGGSWFQFASSCRVSYRGYAPPSYRGSSYGLRLALSSP